MKPIGLTMLTPLDKDLFEARCVVQPVSQRITDAFLEPRLRVRWVLRREVETVMALKLQQMDGHLT